MYITRAEKRAASVVAAENEQTGDTKRKEKRGGRRGVNQSIKHPHKPTHGQGEADPSTTSKGNKPCVAKRRRLGG